MDTSKAPNKNDPGITCEELEKLSKAMRSRDFRGLLHNYVDEISDPKHKKEQEDYILQLEEQGDMPKGCVLLRPEIGCCVKSDVVYPNGVYQKCFINVCHSPWIQDFTVEPRDGGSAVDLPYSIGAPRPDKDKHGSACLTFDVCVSTNTFGQCHRQPTLLRVLIESCTEKVNTCYLKGRERIHPDFQVLPKMKCKGDLPGLMSIREDLIKNKEKFWDQREKELESRRLQKQSDGAGEEVLTRKDLKKLTKQAKAKSRIRAQGRRNESAAPESSAAVSEASGREALDGQGAQKVDKDGEFLQDERDLNRRRTTDLQPGEFRIIHQGKVDLSELFGQNSTLPMEKAVPENLRVEIHLGSTVTSSSDIDVSISDDNKTLTVGQKSDPSAVHVVPLPHAVDVSKGRAQFFREKHHLHLVLPVWKSAFLPVFAKNNRESKGEKTESSGEAGAPVESEHRENAQSLFWAEEKTKPGKNQERIQGGGALCGASTESPDAGGCLDGEDKHAVDQTLDTPRENANEEEALLSSSSPKPQHCREKEGWGGCEAAQKRCGSLESERASDACNRAFDGDELSSAAFPGGQRGAETALLCEKSSDRERLSDFETRETGANACEEETNHVCSEETGTTSEEERRKTDGEFLEVVEPEFCRIARRDSARSPSDSEEQHNVEDAECLLDAEGCPDLEETVLTSEGASGFPQEQTHAVSLEKLEIRSPLLIGAESREAEERADEGESERISFVDCGHVFVAPSEEDREENEKTLGLPGSPSRNKAQEVNANSAEQERIEETHDCEKQKLEDPEVVEARQNLLLRFRLPPGFMPYAHRTSKVEVTDSRKLYVCFHARRACESAPTSQEKPSSTSTEKLRRVHLFYWEARAVEDLDGAQHRLYFRQSHEVSLVKREGEEEEREIDWQLLLSKEEENSNATKSVEVKEGVKAPAVDCCKEGEKGTRISETQTETQPEGENSSPLCLHASGVKDVFETTDKPARLATCVAHVVLRKKRRERWRNTGEEGSRSRCSLFFADEDSEAEALQSVDVSSSASGERCTTEGLLQHQSPVEGADAERKEKRAIEIAVDSDDEATAEDVGPDRAGQITAAGERCERSSAEDRALEMSPGGLHALSDQSPGVSGTDEDEALLAERREEASDASADTQTRAADVRREIRDPREEEQEEKENEERKKNGDEETTEKEAVETHTLDEKEKEAILQSLFVDFDEDEDPQRDACTVGRLLLLHSRLWLEIV